MRRPCVITGGGGAHLGQRVDQHLAIYLNAISFCAFGNRRKVVHIHLPQPESWTVPGDFNLSVGCRHRYRSLGQLPHRVRRQLGLDDRRSIPEPFDLDV